MGAENLFESIRVRRACRTYDMAPLSASALAQIAEQAAAIPVLLGGQDLSTEILAFGQVRGPLRAKAPHYLVIYGSGDQWDRPNAGFVFEQWVL